jgi:hypothetical protein
VQNGAIGKTRALGDLRFPVYQNHIHAARCQFVKTGNPRQSSADDDNWALRHCASSSLTPYLSEQENSNIWLDYQRRLNRPA